VILTKLEDGRYLYCNGHMVKVRIYTFSYDIILGLRNILYANILVIL